MACKTKKGQSAVEALVYVGMFLFITVFFSIFLLSQQAQDLRQRQYRLASETAGQIADAIELAALAGPGFNATFAIPSHIMARPYTANITRAGSLYITVLSPPGMFRGESVEFYYPLGRGNFDVDTGVPGNGKSGNYQGSDFRFYRAYWFNTSRGYFGISVGQDGTITIK